MRHVVVVGLSCLVGLAPSALADEATPSPPDAPSPSQPPSPPTTSSTPTATAPTTETAAPAATSTEPAPGDEFNLEDIQKAATQDALNATTAVASSTALRLRDTPGIVTVITRDEIRRLAPRDLLDLLHLVPGFAFGTDVDGSIGPIFRGIWGQEGKVLVLWDGFEINETMYLTAPLQNHFPLQSIERIEIIRGPGSAQYGGYAELAVINIIPRGASVNGWEVGATYGQMGDSFGRANAELVYGQHIVGGALDGVELALNVFGGEAAQSNRTYDDKLGSSYPMDWTNNRQGPTWLNASLRWGGLEVRGLVDLFRVAQRDYFSESLDQAINNSFYAAHLDVRYKLKLGDVVEVEPRINMKRQLPWFTGGTFLDYVSADSLYYKYDDRVRLMLPVRWFPLRGVVVTAGLDAYGDAATVVKSPDGKYEGLNVPFQNGEAQIFYGNVAAFADVSVQHEIANLTLGARYEYHSVVGPSFVPRFAVTRGFGPLWVKGLFSGAFKPPGIENLKLNDKLLPERATVYEAELGYNLTDAVALSGTLYRVELERPIVYFFDAATDTENYVNFNRTGSEGVEAELRMQDTWGGLDANYTFATSDGLNDVALYESGTRGVLRAVPTHKATFAARFNVTSNLTASPTVVMLSERRGWLGAAKNKVEVEPPAALASFGLVYRDLFVDGLDGTLAVHNLLDTNYRYLQPYDGGHMPLPAPGREFMARMTYRF